MKKLTRRITMGLALLIAGGGSLLCQAAPGGDFDHRHAKFAEVLVSFVDDRGLVDYAGLKDHSSLLSSYLEDLGTVDSDTYQSWMREQQLAYLINLYNAQTLELVVRHYPVKSIKDIGNWYRGPWGQPVVSLMGKVTTLDFLEHKVIRPMFREPAVHFALVCASRGCPPLRREPYVADHLMDQLRDQGRIFLSDKSKNRVDDETGTLYLSAIFKWFREDFTGQAGSLQAFVAPYLPANSSQRLESHVYGIKFLDYDWSLNDQR